LGAVEVADKIPLLMMGAAEAAEAADGYATRLLWIVLIKLRYLSP
jgi:hypothetical protein